MPSKPPKNNLKSYRPEFEDDPPHPDGFPGSDEGSHYMATREGLKGLGYGLNQAQQGITPQDFGITSQEAQELLAKIHKRFPETAQITDKINAEIHRVGHHALKTWTECFDAVIDGRKMFEIRKNDRNFRAGDTLLLRDWDRKVGKYTGRKLEVEVTYVTDGEDLECLASGYICMGIRKVVCDD